MPAPLPQMIKRPDGSDAPKAKAIEVFEMQAVHGLLIHPYTHTRFVPEKSLPHEIDNWTQGQIDAGKLKIV